MEREGLREQPDRVDPGPGPLTAGAGPPSPAKPARPSAGGRLRRAISLIRRAASVEQNPFLASELRSQVRRARIFRDLLLQALAVAALFFGFFLLVRGHWQTDLSFLQRALAPHFVTAVAALHAWMVVYASDSRVREAAQREEAARMWEMLLVTPLSPTEIVLFKSVFPLLYAGLAALIALPVYLLAAAMSGFPFSRLAILYLLYALLMARLVAPVRPAAAGGARRWRRPSPGASAFGNLFGWIWLLSWAGRWLLPAAPLGGALIITWPVTWPIVAATALPTSYPFYRVYLPPFVALLLLGPPLFVLNLRWAGRRLLAHAAEAPGGDTPGLLRRAVVVGVALVILGYAWPSMVEASGLGAWTRLGSTPAASAAALGWLLLALWWLLFGAGGLLTLAAEHRDTVAYRPPRFYSGWLSGAGSRRGSAAAIARLIVPPLLILAAGCAISGRFPSPALLPWLGRVLVVAFGAAALTTALAARLQRSLAANSPAGLILTQIVILGLLFFSAILRSWPDSPTYLLSALSPVIGFLVLLPASAPHSPQALPLPWWLSPTLSMAAVFLLTRRGTRTAADVPTAARGRAQDGRLGRWVERVAARWDQPVLIRELRVGARRGDWRRLLTLVAAGLGLLFVIELTSPRFLSGLATSLPLRLIPEDLPEARLLSAAVMTVILLVLTWLMAFSAPVLGARSFAQERRSGTLGFLLMTPLSEGEIVRGKLLGAVAPLLMALAVCLPVAGGAALLALSPGVLWSFMFGFSWLLIACLTGAAFGVLASLLMSGWADPAGFPLMAVLALQVTKLYCVARLQYFLTGAPWFNGKIEIMAWYVVPLVAVEAGVGLLAYIAAVAWLARTRRRDLRSVAEK